MDEEFYKRDIEFILKKLEEAGMYSEEEGLIERHSDFEMYNPKAMKKIAEMTEFIRKYLFDSDDEFKEQISFEIDRVFDVAILSYEAYSLDIPSILMGEFALRLLDTNGFSVEGMVDESNGKMRFIFQYNDFILRENQN